jgi:hypothetical protein
MAENEMWRAFQLGAREASPAKFFAKYAELYERIINSHKVCFF